MWLNAPQMIKFVDLKPSTSIWCEIKHFYFSALSAEISVWWDIIIDNSGKTVFIMYLSIFSSKKESRAVVRMNTTRCFKHTWMHSCGNAGWGAIVCVAAP